MKFFAVVLVAAGLVAAGQDTTTSDTTTTVTSTTTMTMTLTRCNPTYSDCPYNTPTAETTPSFPAHNTTMLVNSTGGLKNHTAAPTIVTATQTSIAAGSSSTGAVVISQSGAGSLLVNSGLLMGVLAAGAALL